MENVAKSRERKGGGLERARKRMMSRTESTTERMHAHMRRDVQMSGSQEVACRNVVARGKDVKDQVRSSGSHLYTCVLMQCSSFPHINTSIPVMGH